MSKMLLYINRNYLRITKFFRQDGINNCKSQYLVCISFVLFFPEGYYFLSAVNKINLMKSSLKFFASNVYKENLFLIHSMEI